MAYIRDEKKMNVIFHSVVPSLETYSGHEFFYHASVQKVCSELGINFNCWVNANLKINEDVVKTWTKFFNKIKNSRYLAKALIDFSSFFIKIRKKKSTINNPIDLVFLESFNCQELLAFCLAAITFHKSNCKIMILFRYGLVQLRSEGKFHLLAIKLMRIKYKNNLILVTDSENIKKDFLSKASVKLDVLPIPHIDGVHSAILNSSEKLVLWWPGQPRVQKGLNEIQRILKSSDVNAAKMKLVVSCDAKCKNFSGVELVEIKNNLSTQEYEEYMKQANIVLLPYDPEVYKYGTSGILVESICAGKLPIVRPGSWLSDELNRYNLNELVVEWSRDDFFSYIYFLYYDESVRKKLELMKDSYREYHGIQGYSKVLKNILQLS